MARPRKEPASPAYQKRDARARRLGYRNYYDYRLHDNGKLPPGPLVLSPEQRRRRRGHVGRQAFLASLREGDLIIMPFGVSSVVFDPKLRKGQGAYLEIVKLVISASNGRERTYSLRRLTRDELVETIAEEQRRGAIFSPAPSLDQRRLVSELEASGGY